MQKQNAICAAVGLLLTVFISTSVKAQRLESGLSLLIRATDSRYYLGQPLELSFAATNSSHAALTSRPSVELGNVHLLVSEDDKSYREYIGADWSTKSLPLLDELAFREGETVEFAANLLFNRRPDTEHLTPVYAAYAWGGRIDTQYVAVRGGRYYLKAIFLDADAGVLVESNVIEIDFIEPTEDSGRAWELLRDTKGSALFMQLGKLPSDSGASERLESVLNEIVERFPKSIYSETIQDKLRNVRLAKKTL